VYEQINALDIYLQTSLWEGLPIAVLEAMALMKPVIATKINGNKDTVIPNETGFLYQEMSELTAYFKTLEDPLTRVKFGTKALYRCKDLFDTNKNFTALEKVYERYFFAATKDSQK
jgi:glycosyltransferase involved in cell wall biosynthesis